MRKLDYRRGRVIYDESECGGAGEGGQTEVREGEPRREDEHSRRVRGGERVPPQGRHRRLRGAKRRKGTKRKGRPPVYTPDVVAALWQVWEICGRICSKRLAPFSSEAMAVLEREGEIRFPTEIGDRLIWMSPASIDRLLGPTAIASERDDAPPNRGRCCAYRFRCARLRIGRTLSRGFSRSTWAHTVLRPLPGSSSTP
jgi:hypothetical protein